jgi:hypothetical protein
MLRFVMRGKIKDLEIIEIEKRVITARCEIGTLMCIDVPEFSLDCTTSSPFILFILAFNLIQPKTFNSIVLYLCQSLFRYPKRELVIDRLLAVS